MVYVNSKKYACESCIKGHRSSLCHHSERPLFEIKKKGRPLSQCDQCRAARRSRKLHSKCECNNNNNNEDDQSKLLAAASKFRRYIPIVPALPNGLKDVLHSQPNSGGIPKHPKQGVDALLNPCLCKDVWKCQCRKRNVSGSSTSKTSESRAEVAANQTAGARTPGKSSSCCQRPMAPSSVRTHGNRLNETQFVQYHLPPVITPSNGQTNPPIFPVMPPMSTIKLLAGSGCTCGLQCRCPGCVEHRTPELASKHRKDCGDGCGTCVDHAGGIELPNLTAPQASGSRNSTNNYSHSNPSSIIDQFFARAAALPQPPPKRKMGVHLDPMDLNMYYYAANNGTEGLPGARRFEVINLPKLKCWSGHGDCSEGRCQREECREDGCADHTDGRAVGLGVRGPVASPLVMQPDETATRRHSRGSSISL